VKYHKEKCKYYIIFCY